MEKYIPLFEEFCGMINEYSLKGEYDILNNIKSAGRYKDLAPATPANGGRDDREWSKKYHDYNDYRINQTKYRNLSDKEEVRQIYDKERKKDKDAPSYGKTVFKLKNEPEDDNERNGLIYTISGGYHPDDKFCSFYISFKDKRASNTSFYLKYKGGWWHLTDGFFKDTDRFHDVDKEMVYDLLNNPKNKAAFNSLLAAAGSNDFKLA